MLAKIKYSKCAGCAALQVKSTYFGCKLGFKINYKVVDGKAFNPCPVGKCYRPKTESVLDELMEKVA